MVTSATNDALLVQLGSLVGRAAGVSVTGAAGVSLASGNGVGGSGVRVGGGVLLGAGVVVSAGAAVLQAERTRAASKTMKNTVFDIGTSWAEKTRVQAKVVTLAM
jgi:hypothetical protein